MCPELNGPNFLMKDGVIVGVLQRYSLSLVTPSTAERALGSAYRRYVLEGRAHIWVPALAERIQDVGLQMELRGERFQWTMQAGKVYDMTLDDVKTMMWADQLLMLEDVVLSCRVQDPTRKPA